ncbi:MAG: hypothetical protein AVDCRST_MAG53-2524, partial [uncultured Solirubrobacteraceae bacterium]
WTIQSSGAEPISTGRRTGTGSCSRSGSGSEPRRSSRVDSPVFSRASKRSSTTTSCTTSRQGPSRTFPGRASARGTPPSPSSRAAPSSRSMPTVFGPRSQSWRSPVAGRQTSSNSATRRSRRDGSRSSEPP